MKLISIFCSALFLGIVFSGCTRASDDGLLVVEAFECPAPAASAEVNLHHNDSRLYLSWLVHEEDSHSFQFATLENNSWSATQEIFTGKHFFANWADLPSIVELADGSLLAHWLSKSAEDTFAYDVMLSHSTEGKTWSPPQSPHDDGTPTEHGFVSLVPTLDNNAWVVWLDGRDYNEKEHDEAQMSLRVAHFTAKGLGDAKVLDARTCDCCPTKALLGNDGNVVVAYRDRSEKEVRDISLVHFDESSSKWSKPKTLETDDWQISGCPVNGPQMDLQGNNVVAAWYTIRDSEPMVRVAFSKDGGHSFSPSIRVDQDERQTAAVATKDRVVNTPLGRTDVVLLPSGDALVIWLNSTSTGDGEIRARRVHSNGKAENSFRVTKTTADRASGFPQVELFGDKLYFAWTVPGEPSSISMATLSLPKDWR